MQCTEKVNVSLSNTSFIRLYKKNWSSKRKKRKQKKDRNLRIQYRRFAIQAECTSIFKMSKLTRLAYYQVTVSLTIHFHGNFCRWSVSMSIRCFAREGRRITHFHVCGWRCNKWIATTIITIIPENLIRDWGVGLSVTNDGEDLVHNDCPQELSPVLIIRVVFNGR